MQKTNIKAIIGLMLLIFVVYIPIACAQIEKQADNSVVKPINIELNKEGGILLIPTNSNTITDLSTTAVSEKIASASLFGTIDDKNHLTLEGTITLDGRDKKVKLSGEATQVFIGWDVPEGAKPIYYEVANRTMTRYEGATKIYSIYVNVKDNSGKYNLHGEFYENGNGGFVGTVEVDGKECQLGLRGNSISLYESVTPSVEIKSSNFLTVPQRSQWEIYYNQGNLTAASNACGETCAAMLEEYWSANHPTIWSIWVYNGYESMNSAEAQDYLDDQGVYLSRGVKSGTLSYTIDEIEDMIDDGRPFYLTEESQFGNCHAVVLRGYYDALIDPYFELNDPNTWTGTNTMYWYETDNSYFNYEENVYEYTGSSDTSSTGYAYLG